MFLEELFNTTVGQNMNKWARENSTFNACYMYWREQLFERIMRLFVWEDTGVVKPKEIEQRLLINGHCGIAEFKGELTAFYGSFNGVTKYMDEWTHYNVRCPIYSDRKEIGTEVIVIDNTSIRNSAMALIHHYAIMLGHTEVTLINLLVNARDAGGVPIASTEKQKKSIHEYLAKLFNGQYGVVTDTGALGVTYAGSDRHTQQDLMRVMETREKLIKSFYSDIGVRSAFEKRNNTVMAEVEADTSLLLLNLSDMLHCREIGAEEVNKRFGTSWKVHVAEEIDYNDENARYQFDTITQVHVREGEEDDNTKLDAASA
jgi:hypothetical protein